LISPFGLASYSVPNFVSARKTSAMVDACAAQPRGVKGGSASKTSLIVPMQEVPGSARNRMRKRDIKGHRMVETTGCKVVVLRP
jgi:hypothetical protein